MDFADQPMADILLDLDFNFDDLELDLALFADIADLNGNAANEPADDDEFDAWILAWGPGQELPALPAVPAAHQGVLPALPAEQLEDDLGDLPPEPPAAAALPAQQWQQQQQQPPPQPQPQPQPAQGPHLVPAPALDIFYAAAYGCPPPPPCAACPGMRLHVELAVNQALAQPSA